MAKAMLINPIKRTEAGASTGVQAHAAKPDDLSAFQEPMWRKEETER